MRKARTHLRNSSWPPLLRCTNTLRANRASNIARPVLRIKLASADGARRMHWSMVLSGTLRSTFSFKP